MTSLSEARRMPFETKNKLIYDWLVIPRNECEQLSLEMNVHECLWREIARASICNPRRKKAKEFTWCAGPILWKYMLLRSNTVFKTVM